MGLTMKERKAIIRELAPKYQKERKRERGKILDEFVRLTELERGYASHVLKNYGTRKSVVLDGKRTVVVLGQAGKSTRKRQKTYDEAVIDALQRLWAFSNGLCGKLLTVFIRQTLPVLERWGEMTLAEPIRAKVMAISPATIDRLLASTKKKSALKGRTHTKPGTLLKHHIPMRTFSDWNESVPGFVEIDLVAHDGGVAYGDYAQTLDVTDIATTWTETRVVRNKAQRHVFEALRDIRGSLPFPLLGIDSDNGGEFINGQLYQYCVDEGITFTRSRPHRKNDNCFVEQKNYSVVRKTVGHYRYDTPEQLELLRSLYGLLRLYTNFFQPSMKLREKLRQGSHVTRRYDPPMTPYRRVLEHPAISDDAKNALSTLYATLNPAQIMRTMAGLQQQLFESAVHAPKIIVPQGHPAPDHRMRNHAYRSRLMGFAQRKKAQKAVHTSTSSASKESA
jgi:hypothetical protein